MVPAVVTCLLARGNSGRNPTNNKTISTKVIYYTWNTQLYFGKHKGLTVQEIWDTDPSYLYFCIREVDNFMPDDSIFKKVHKYIFIPLNIFENKEDILADNIERQNQLQEIYEAKKERFLNQKTAISKSSQPVINSKHRGIAQNIEEPVFQEEDDTIVAKPESPGLRLTEKRLKKRDVVFIWTASSLLVGSWLVTFTFIDSAQAVGDAPIDFNAVLRASIISIALTGIYGILFYGIWWISSIWRTK